MRNLAAARLAAKKVKPTIWLRFPKKAPRREAGRYSPIRAAQGGPARLPETV